MSFGSDIATEAAEGCFAWIIVFAVVCVAVGYIAGRFA